jgi:hypothetical protein
LCPGRINALLADPKSLRSRRSELESGRVFRNPVAIARAV